MSARRAAAAVVLVGAILGVSCARAGDPPEGMVLVGFEGGVITAEVAATRDEITLGLMHRDSLDDDAGMLFLFPGPNEGGFWMKNTLIPLSIAYLERLGPDEFRVLSVLDMDPCRADPCPVYDPGVPYDAALEVNRGWFVRAGVAEGSRATIRGDLPQPEPLPTP